MMHDSYKLYAQWDGKCDWDCMHFPLTLILVYTRTICKRKTLMVWVDYGAEFNKGTIFMYLTCCLCVWPTVNFVLL